MKLLVFAGDTALIIITITCTANNFTLDLLDF